MVPAATRGDRAVRLVRADAEGARAAVEVLRARRRRRGADRHRLRPGGAARTTPTRCRPSTGSRDGPRGCTFPSWPPRWTQVRALGVAFTPAAERAGPALVAGPADAGLRLRRRARTRPAWLAGRDEVAVRIPDHDFLRGAPASGPACCVVTSANPHGAPTPRTARRRGGQPRRLGRPGRRRRAR